MIRRKQIICGMLSMVSSMAYGMLLDSDYDATAIEKKIQISEKKRSIAGASSELVEFAYEQKNLKDLLNEFAQKLNINMLYPETETVAAKVTFDAGKKITMAEAWDFLIMILEQAGFTLVLRGNGIYTLLSNGKSFTEPLPLYIGVDYTQLPDTAERIRFVYYFNNIQSKQHKELTAILGNMITADALKQIVFDETSNLMIITTRSEMIKAVMQLITVLDESGFQEAVEVVKLDHVKASEVVTVLKGLIASGDTKTNKPAASLSSGSRARYFSEYVRVESLEPKDAKSTRPLNSVVIMGKMGDIEEIKKFIKKYLDIALGSGDSFFHVVDLQWLNATKFVKVLKDLVKGGGGQSSSSLSSDLGFEPHIQIMAETITAGSTDIGASVAAAGAPSQGAAPAGASAVNVVQRGGNKLIIACSPKDWARIESLIKQLDIPQKQVIIEALVMDLDLAFSRSLGAQIRTRGLDPSIFPKNMQAQAGLLINNIIASDYPTVNPPLPSSYTLLGDLSDILNPDGLAGTGTNLALPQVSTTLTPSSPSGAAASGVNGSTIFMINGGKARTNGVWAFFQLLSSHTSSKVFTRPVLMVQNNQLASVTSTVTKTLPGTVTSAVNPTVNFTPLDATVSIQFTPLISANDTVNLQIVTQLNSWLVNDDASGTQTVRKLNTNVSMKSGDLLVLGGLISDSTKLSKQSVPFFERIPIIGNLFAARAKTITKDQLYILIRVTVVEPRTEGGMGPITRSSADFMIDQLAEYEEAFAGLKDPVTRWFFSSDRNQSAAEYMEEKISELPAFDLGRSGTNIQLDKNETVHVPRKTGDNMKIGWFSNAPSNSNFASRSSSNGDMDKLSTFLKDLENPFEKRLQV